MRGSWGWSLAIVIWTLALAGIVFKTTSLGFRFHRTSVALYVVMGWLGGDRHQAADGGALPA